MPTLLAIEPARYHHLTGTRGPKSATRFNVPLDATGRLPDYTREKKCVSIDDVRVPSREWRKRPGRQRSGMQLAPQRWLTVHLQ
jgi:hypothetical protein